LLDATRSTTSSGLTRCSSEISISVIDVSTLPLRRECGPRPHA
jgi:hypothetical protein